MRSKFGKWPEDERHRVERDCPVCSFFDPQARRWLCAIALGPVEFKRTHVTAGPAIVVTIDDYSVDSSSAGIKCNAAGDLMRLPWHVWNIIVLPNQCQSIHACPGVNAEYRVIAT